ncbi:MAG: signal peptidase I [Silanimonas sp.]
MKFDFALILTALTLLCGAFWLVDKLVLAKRRGPDGKPNDTVDFFASLFPVLAVVLCLRSFVYEPFRIPSSSMMPTLLIGDFILVNKFAYGVRLPVTNTLLFETGKPERGDVAVFRYPGRPQPLPGDQPVGTDYIKRVIGLPGDTITSLNNRLTINGTPIVYGTEETYVGVGAPDAIAMTGATRVSEALAPGHEHQILDKWDRQFSTGDGTWTVPEGHYFVMGDNRVASDDGRFWGFVPEANLAGRADVIWLNCANWACVDSFDWRRMGDVIR